MNIEDQINMIMYQNHRLETAPAVDETVWNLIPNAKAWALDGFTPEEAMAWHNAGFIPSAIGNPLFWATGWREHFVDPQEARSWKVICSPASYAKSIKNRGFTPETYRLEIKAKCSRRECTNCLWFDDDCGCLTPEDAEPGAKPVPGPKERETVTESFEYNGRTYDPDGCDFSSDN